MVNEDNIAVRVEGVSKDFILPHEKRESVKSIFVHLFKRNKRVETQHALKDISFTIKKGEFFGIVGRNGSGKSTLLKIIAGIYQPTRGRVTLNGRLVPFIELGVGFNPELSGRENVYLNGALMGFSNPEIRKKYDEIVAFSELERFMDQKLKNYSSGMQVRLAFSVATILADSDILLVDEVLAVGDADFQRKCFDYFRSLKKLKKTVIFVSHDMNAVVEYCDRAILIEKSKQVKEGTAERVATAYKRMFLEQDKANGQNNPAEDRWGDRALIINNPQLSHAHLTDGNKCVSIQFDVTINKDVELPVIGFALKTSMGTILLGTNNNIQKQRIDHLRKGATIRFKWDVPNIFSDGSYAIDLAAEYLNGAQVGDRWESALVFDVVKEQRTPYSINPDIGLTMMRQNDKQ